MFTTAVILILIAVAASLVFDLGQSSRMERCGNSVALFGLGLWASGEWPLAASASGIVYGVAILLWVGAWVRGGGITIGRSAR